MQYLHWHEVVNEQISFLRLLGSNWYLFWRIFMTNWSYINQRNNRQLSLKRTARWAVKVTNHNSHRIIRLCRFFLRVMTPGFIELRNLYPNLLIIHLSSLWYPYLIPTVRPDTHAISKTIASMNVKFCRVLKTSLNVLEMLKLFT